MSTDVPILNHYKRKFVGKRILQTFLSGLRLTGVPWYTIPFQIIIFLTPLGAILPYILLNDSTLLLSLVLATVISIWALILQTLGKLFFWLSSIRSDDVVQELNNSNGHLQEENEVQLNGLCNVQAWAFLLPAKKHWINIPIHALVSALMLFSTSQFLGKTNDVFVQIFGWISVLQAFHALIVVAPPEPAMFRAHDSLELNSMSRAFHVIFCSLVHWIDFESDISNYAQFCSRIILITLPIQWVLGILPPFEALILWLIEQCQIVVFGGTPSATLLRAVGQFALSLIHCGVLLFLQFDQWLVVILSGITGYLLSMDWIGMFKSASHRRSINSPILNGGKKSSGKDSVIQSEGCLFWKEVVTHCCFFLLNAIVIVMKSPVVMENETFQASNITAANNTNNATNLGPELTNDSLFAGWAVIGSYICFKVTNELQKVFFLYGLFKSPLYHGCSVTNDLFIITWRHLRAIIFNFIAGLLLSYYLMTLVTPWKEDDTWKVIEILAIIRNFRWVWQSTESALIELSIFHLYSVFIEPNYSTLTFLSGHVKILFIGFGRDRMKQIIEKIYLVSSLTISSLEDRASKRSYAGCLFQADLIMAPIILAMVFISSLFAAPLLAAFSLPLYFLAFPRPIRFWSYLPNSASSNNSDAIYYEQMIPPLLNGIHQALRAGRLGLQQPGNFLLARHEDKTVWIQIVEKGNGYIYYQAKGLELQETSCHSLEVTRIDDIFEDTFVKQSGFNHFAFHTLTPLVSLPIVTYASSKNVLTGVIESKDTLALVAQIYEQALVWYTLKSLLEINSKGRSAQKEVHVDVEAQQIHEALNHSEHDVIHGLKASSSIEAVNLDSWPSSESSPDGFKSRATTAVASAKSNAYFIRKASSEESFPSLDEDFNVPIKRKGLLPPIKMEPNLPGGINFSVTPELPRRKSVVTMISPRDSMVSPSSIDETLAGALTPPQEWLEVIREAHRDYFLQEEEPLNKEWLKYCLQCLLTLENLESYGFESKQSAIDNLLKDIIFINRLKELVDGCVRIVYGSSSNTADIATQMGPGLVVRAFNGKTQSSSLAKIPILQEKVAIPAFRSALKASLDQIIIQGDSVVTNTDLGDAFTDIDANWHLGLEDSPTWASAIRKRIPNLFSISSSDLTNANSLNSSKSRQIYRSHLLTLRQCSINVGRLNSEVVRSLWASLSWELLYLTNDDDERYSIQAEERLLRNLSVEVADPPLGYPSFTSVETRHGLEYF